MGKTMTGNLDKDRKQFLKQIETYNTRGAKARNLLIDGKLESSDLNIIKSEAEDTVARLEAKALEHANNMKNILKRVTNALLMLGKVYREGTTANKHEIIGSIFPEKMYFEDDAYRTTKINDEVMLIYQLIQRIGRK